MVKTIIRKLLPQTIRLSLRYRLLAFLFSSFVLLMSVTVVIVNKAVNHELQEILDGQMVVTGRAIFSMIALEVRRSETSNIPDLLTEFVRERRGLGDWIDENPDRVVYDSEYYFQLNDPSGAVVFSSTQPQILESQTLLTGLFTIDVKDNEWHLLGLQDRESRYTFYIGQSEALRQKLSKESVRYILLPFLLVSVFILGAMWIGISRILRPLLQLTRELDTRTPTMLDTIPLDQKAMELRPLISVLNSLFSRVRTSIVAERQFSADASHELRSPLAGIKANLDAAICLSAVPEQKKYLDNIELCVENATKVTEGLLLLSKLQSADPNAYFEYRFFDIFDVVQRELDKHIFLRPSEESRVSLQCSPLNGSSIFHGPENLFEVAVGNIIDNALKYSTGPIEITVCNDDQKNILVIVDDQGPGIPEAKLDLIFNRFYRVDTDTTKGFGLGLALARQIVALLGGAIRLTNRSPSGLSVTLSLPVAAESGSLVPNVVPKGPE